MCACCFNYVCLDHRGTRHDPAYFDEPGPAELEAERRNGQLGMPDFKTALKDAA